MQITLSTQEALTILSEHFAQQLNSNVRVDIISSTPTAIPAPINNDALTTFFRNMERVADKKVFNIKALRESIPGLGLANAKYMVEALMEHGNYPY